MSGLDLQLFLHKLNIKEEYRPVKQALIALHCSSNVAEYKDLTFGFISAMKMGIQKL